MRVLRAAVCLLWAAPVALAAALARQPYLQDLRDGRVTILWSTTGEAGEGEVRFGADGSYSERAASTARQAGDPAAPFYQHTAVLRELRKDTLYSYRVFVDGVDVLPGAVREELQFRTPGDSHFVFLAVGDSGDGGSGQQLIAGRMAKEPAALALHVGDIAYDIGTFQQFDDYFFTIYHNLLKRMPFFMAPGNHDYFFEHAAAYRALFAPPTETVPTQDRGLYYSFDWGGAHFTVIDSNEPLAAAVTGNGGMLRWLDADLARTDKIWRIVMFHHLPFPNTQHVSDELCAMAAKYVTPILERHGVHLVLNGHEHNYQRAKPRRGGEFADLLPGTVYVTTGGGGAGVYAPSDVPYLVKGAGVQHYLRAEVTGARMAVRAIGVEGEVVDEFTLTAAPEVFPNGVRDAAAFSAAVSPGALISIFGKDLSTLQMQANTLPLPVDLAGVRVTMGEVDAPLLFVSRGQINAQVPFDLQGRIAMRIRAPGGTAEAVVSLVETAPAFYMVERDGVRVPAITHLDGTVVTARNPAVTGEWLVAYLNGLGRVDGAMRTLAAVKVTVGGLEAEVNYGGLAPGLAGVYQVNFRAPPVGAGRPPVLVVAGGVTSEAVALSTR